MLKANLGVSLKYETMDFGAYQDRLASDPPDIWSLSWVADYPGPNDFLGVLLIPGHAVGESKELLAVPFHQHPKRIALARKRALDGDAIALSGRALYCFAVLRAPSAFAHPNH